MGTPMRPIDPAGGFVHEFAAELRQLRESAGNPPFRQMARRAHYSATTLSVACSGTSLPSLEVTLAFVNACDGPVEHWRRRWQDADGMADMPASGSTDPGSPGEQGQRPKPDSGLARRGTRFGAVATAPVSLRGRFGPPALLAIAAVAGATGWWAGHPAAAQSGLGRPESSALHQLYVGVSPCDVGAVILSQADLTLPTRMRIAGRDYPAGTLVGVVALRFSPRCALAWTRFVPARELASAHAGSLTISSRRVADGATSALTMSPVVAAEGDPVLTVPGCVIAQATVRFGVGLPAVTAMTGCYP